MASDCTSTSSQTEMSISERTTSTHTSQTTSSPIKSALSFQMTLPPKEFTPRSHPMGSSSPTPSSPPSGTATTPSSPRISERSESTMSSILSNSPSDSTNTTKDAQPSPSDSKTDILLSMKMEVIDFSQGYYLKRATELGISVQLFLDKHSAGQTKGERFLRRHVHAPPYKPLRSHLNPRSREFKPRCGITSVFVSGAATYVSREKREKHPSKKSAPPSSVTKSPQRSRTYAPVVAVKEAGKRVGDVWDGYVVEAFEGKDIHSCREWEWDEPVSETVSEMKWNEDEDLKPNNGSKSLGERRFRGSQTGGGGGGGGDDDGDGDGDGDDGGSAAKGGCGGGNGVIIPRNQIGCAPRGKSWMVVTKKMMENYSP